MNINWIENSKLHCIAVFELFVFVCSLGVCVWLGAYVVSTWKIHKLCNGLCVCVCGGVLRSASDTSFHFFFVLVFLLLCLFAPCALCTVQILYDQIYSIYTSWLQNSTNTVAILQSHYVNEWHTYYSKWCEMHLQFCTRNIMQ